MKTEQEIQAKMAQLMLDSLTESEPLVQMMCEAGAKTLLWVLGSE